MNKRGFTSFFIIIWNSSGAGAAFGRGFSFDVWLMSLDGWSRRPLLTRQPNGVFFSLRLVFLPPSLSFSIGLNETTSKVTRKKMNRSVDFYATPRREKERENLPSIIGRAHQVGWLKVGKKKKGMTGGYTQEAIASSYSRGIKALKDKESVKPDPYRKRQKRVIASSSSLFSL